MPVQTPVRQSGFGRFGDGVDSVSLGSSVTIGSLIVVLVQIEGGNQGALTVTSVATGSDTLTAAVQREHADGGLDIYSGIFYGIATGTSPTATVTLSGNNTGSHNSSLTIYEFDEANTLDDTSSADHDGVDSFDSGAVTTAAPGAVLVGGTVGFDPVTYTIDADFTTNGDDTGWAIGGYDIAGAAGDYSMVNAGDDFIAAVTVLAAFSDSGGGAVEIAVPVRAVAIAGLVGQTVTFDPTANDARIVIRRST